MDQCSLSPAAAEQDRLIGRSTSMSRVRELIERVGPTDATVLLVGESGTGKELVAEAVHRRSSRAAGPFVAVNCGAIPELLVEAELFGHEKGSFTGAIRTQSGFLERADGGTLFLDEITEMPIEMQVPLLRFLESRRYFKVGGRQEIAADVRVIAATNRVPHDAIRNRKLREDLYYRLAVFPLELPPLRERDDDAVALAEHFLATLNVASGTCKRLSQNSRDLALRYSWPGNVRELRHAIERSFILADDTLELADALEWDSRRSQFATSNGGGNTLQVAIGSRLRDVEKSLIEATLEHFAGNKRHTADALGCSLKTLYNKLNTYSRLAREM
jgi:transcriptional regulator with PAS, ATPase and Fis domain